MVLCPLAIHKSALQVVERLKRAPIPEETIDAALEEVLESAKSGSVIVLAPSAKTKS